MTEALPDSYRTLAAEVSHEIKVKGSRFIGLGGPIENEQAAEDTKNSLLGMISMSKGFLQNAQDKNKAFLTVLDKLKIETDGKLVIISLILTMEEIQAIRGA